MAADAFKVFKAIPVTKAGVLEFLGSEITDRSLRDSVEPDQKYRLLRSPQAWRESAESWSAVPILRGHPERGVDYRHAVIGSTDRAWFEDLHLCANLVIWDRLALDEIESGERRGLSLGYSGPTSMRPGNYWGEAFDGEIGPPIVGHHLSLVPRSRSGLVIGDGHAAARHVSSPHLAEAYAAI